MKTVIEMAREAGFTQKHGVSGRIVVRHSNGSYVVVEEMLKEFAAIVREDEREACAKVAENYFEFADMNVFDDAIGFAATKSIAAAIRARGTK